MVVGLAVVSSTKQTQIGGFGAAPIGPMSDVVGVAPAGGDVAARVGAAAVAQLQRPPQRGGNDPATGTRRRLPATVAHGGDR